VNALATAPWPQPIAPLGSVGASALAAAIPLAIVMVMMGVFRRSGLLSSACGLLAVIGLAVTVWHMPVSLAGWSIGYGVAVAAWSILWMVFNAIWLYNLTLRTGSFDRLRRWIAGHASGDACIQAVLVAFCFGALLEGSAGFGAPVAISAFLLVGLGFEPRRAVLVSLVSNTAPVAFGSVGVPIIALASVTGLDIMRLSAMVGRQLPLLSLLLPLYLTVVVAGWAGLRRTWGVAAVAGASFALTQFVVSNRWGPYATDILSALVSIGVTVAALRLRAAPRV
jgi:lactate permease